MLAFRDRGARGKAELGWLSSRHSFSFGGYQDPQHMGFRALRVINEDRVIPGAGFGTHSHADMEIISYVLEGALEHKDSLGTGAVIRPGEIQRMSAGTGVEHSEFNASGSEPVHFLQIWIIPAQRGIVPSYEQKALPSVEAGETRLDLIGSPDGREGSVIIHQDLLLYRAMLADGGVLNIPIASGRHAWVQVARGTVEIDGGEMREGDGLAISDAAALALNSTTGAELLVFDLA
jgi:redox-sensitive bicupin YhaK (pirin superfamily)